MMQPQRFSEANQDLKFSYSNTKGEPIGALSNRDSFNRPLSFYAGAWWFGRSNSRAILDAINLFDAISILSLYIGLKFTYKENKYSSGWRASRTQILLFCS